MGATERSLSKEEELLVLAARIGLDGPDGERMTGILQGDVDWPKLMEYSEALGVRPLLCRHFSDQERVRLVPEDVMGSLRREHQVQALRNLRIYGCLRRVLHLGSQAGIPIILLKGAFLAEWIYPDIGLRPMSDIDILCRTGDHKVFLEQLCTAGFESQYSEEDAYNSPIHAKFFSAHGFHLPPVYDHRVSRIEVHSSIFCSREPAGCERLEELLWAKSLRHDWDGLPFGSLSPAHQVLHLCSHLHHHIESDSAGLQWLCDIHETIHHYGNAIDWEAFRRTAEELGILSKVKTVLLLLREHWSTPIPDLPGKCRRPRLADILRNRYSGGSAGAGRAMLSNYLRSLLIAGQVSGWRNRLRFVWALVFPSRANIRYRYHPDNALTLCFWYAAHPFILAASGIAGLCHHLASRVGLRS